MLFRLSITVWRINEAKHRSEGEMMEKALEILRNDNVFDHEYLAWNKYIKIDEAIAELEELQPKSCEGCKHHIIYDMPEGDIHSCVLYERDETLCVRKFRWLDKYELKEPIMEHTKPTDPQQGT